ncbi:MAG: hypothetical protein ACRDRL_07370, partial [Sciscionella sp.]
AYDSYGDLTQTVKNAVSGGAHDSQTNVTTSSTYNILGQQLTSADALGVITQYSPDVVGNVTKTIQNYQLGGPSGYDSPATNVTTTASFDALDRPWTQTSAPMQAYANGSLTVTQVVTLTEYDNDGRAIGTVVNCTALAGESCFVNNTAVNTQGTLTANSATQTNLLSATAYDAAGNATLATDAKGNTTTTTYDADNRATEVVAKDVSNPSTPTISDKTTMYDLAGDVTQTQVMDGASNPITSYTYDAAGRQVTEADPPADPTDTTTSDPGYVANVTATSYDQDGNATEQAVTNANVSGAVSDTKMTYDALGRTLTKVEDANTSGSQTTSYTYDANGQQLSVTQPATNGTTQNTTTYDALGRVATATQQAGTGNAQTTSYTYDAGGRTLTTSNSAGSTSDSYDALGRTLTETRYDTNQVVQTVVATTYDTHGNALTTVTSYATSPSVTVTRAFDALDHLASLSDGQRTYSYDLNGNSTSMEVVNPSTGNTRITAASDSYDGGNRLTTQKDYVGTAPDPLETDLYTYNAAGDRVTASANAAQTTYT